MKLLDDKVVIITGAGRAQGMGQAAARKFAEHGAKVVISDLIRDKHEEEDRAAIEAVASQVRGQGVDALAVGVDVTDPQQVESCVAASIDAFGTVDVLVNNAGTAIGAGPLLEQTDTQWDVSYGVHVKGTFYFCRAVIPVMQRQGGGVIVNNASMLGIAAEPFAAAYITTKFGVVGLTKAIAAEFGKDNIRCNAVCPGSIKTQMQGETIGMFAEWYGVTEAQAWADAERCALGRSAEPEEVADAMVYLASPMASYVSGVALPVTGAANPGV